MGAVKEGFLEHAHLEDSAREGWMERENDRKCALGRENIVCTGLWGMRESGSFEELLKEDQVVLVGDQSVRGGPRHERGDAKGQASESKWEEVQPRLLPGIPIPSPMFCTYKTPTWAEAMVPCPKETS